LRFKLFFSVDGRDVEGREIAGSDETGALRMLVIEQSIFLLSVSTMRWKMRLSDP
jgi:hypothetical protein